ncbi:MAG: CRISPR-associated endonuclease Cas2 [Promethearchaeota archaeon]
MFWVVTYDVPATHDEWRTKIAKKLSDFGLFRIQYSVFVGIRSQNSIEACKIAIEDMLKKDSIPADIRFFPLCKSCEQNIMHLNSGNYIASRRRDGYHSQFMFG